MGGASPQIPSARVWARHSDWHIVPNQKRQRLSPPFSLLPKLLLTNNNSNEYYVNSGFRFPLDLWVDESVLVRRKECVFWAMLPWNVLEVFQHLCPPWFLQGTREDKVRQRYRAVSMWQSGEFWRLPKFGASVQTKRGHKNISVHSLKSMPVFLVDVAITEPASGLDSRRAAIHRGVPCLRGRQQVNGENNHKASQNLKV